MRDGSDSPLVLGFLSVVEHEGHGLVGGYLLLNQLGRPLEFHCTTPVRPNRAQQILFGATLRPYLFGEQIGQTLAAKAAIEPVVICTDHVDTLALRDFVATPVVLVLAPDDASHAGGLVGTFQLGNSRLRVAPHYLGDQQQIEARLAALAHFDFVEPFGRIREAVAEALATWRPEPSARCA